MAWAASWVAIVDDDPSVLKALTRLLWTRGFHAKTFVSARKFIAALPDDLPECLIIDLQMPEIAALSCISASCSRALKFRPSSSLHMIAATFANGVKRPASSRICSSRWRIRSCSRRLQRRKQKRTWGNTRKARTGLPLCRPSGHRADMPGGQPKERAASAALSLLQRREVEDKEADLAARAV